MAGYPRRTETFHCVREARPLPPPEKRKSSGGALTPNTSVIASPNNTRRSPLSNAVIRVCQPTRRRPKSNSAPVVITPSGRIIPAGKYQLSLCVYSKNREKLPHATFGCPNDPHRPNLSATAERKLSASAYRKNTELKLSHLVRSNFINRNSASGCLIHIVCHRPSYPSGILYSAASPILLLPPVITAIFPSSADMVQSPSRDSSVAKSLRRFVSSVC